MTLDNQEMTVVNQKCPIFIRKWLQMTRINLRWPLKTLVDQKQIVTRKLPKFNRFNQHCNALACLKRDLEMWQKVSGPCCNISSLWEDIFFSTVAFAWLLMCSMHVLCRNSGRIISTTHARDITHIVMAFCQTKAWYFWISKMFRFWVKVFFFYINLN